MSPVSAFFEEVSASAADYNPAMINKAFEHLLDVKRFRPVINQGNISDSESVLQ